MELKFYMGCGKRGWRKNLSRQYSQFNVRKSLGPKPNSYFTLYRTTKAYSSIFNTLRLALGQWLKNARQLFPFSVFGMKRWSSMNHL